MAIQDYKHKLLLNVNIKLIIVLQKVKFSLDHDGESSSASKEDISDLSARPSGR